MHFRIAAEWNRCSIQYRLVIILCTLQGIMSRLYETAAVLVLVAVVVYGLVRVVSALLDSHTGNSSLQEASSIFFRLRCNDIVARIAPRSRNYATLQLQILFVSSPVASLLDLTSLEYSK